MSEIKSGLEEKQTIYILVEEISDQYGTDKIIGVYSSEEKAKENESRTKRNFIRPFVLDAKAVR